MSNNPYDQRATLVIVLLGFAVTWVLNQPRGDSSPLNIFGRRDVAVQKLTGLPYSPTGELIVHGIHNEWDDEFEVDKKVKRLLPDIDFAPVLLGTWAKPTCRRTPSCPVSIPVPSS